MIEIFGRLTRGNPSASITKIKKTEKKKKTGKTRKLQAHPRGAKSEKEKYRMKEQKTIGMKLANNTKINKSQNWRV